MRRRASLCLGLAILLAGCAADPATSSTTSPPTTSAQPPVVDDDLGSISGSVLDEENAPVGNATIGILETLNETKTDAAGAFTFNGLAAGTYSLVAARLGYADATKRVTVTPGEVAAVTLVLAAVAVNGEPYTLTVPKVGYILLGKDYTQFGTQVANQSGTHEATCEGCTAVIFFDHKPSGMMLETEWPCGCTDPLINIDVWIKYLKDWTTGDMLDGTVVLNTYPTNRAQIKLGDTAVQMVQTAKEDKLLFLLHAGHYLNVQNRVSSYHSFVYNAPDFPEGFTALPPA